MASQLLPDELWTEIEDLFPVHEVSPEGGRPRRTDRAVLTAIIFVLKTGIGWKDLPTEAFGVSPKTMQRRLKEWTECDVWRRMHELLLAKLRGANLLDWSRVIVDTSLIKAPLGGEKSARTRRTAAARGPSIAC